MNKNKVAYIGAFLFILLFLIRKLVKKTKSVKAESADLSQGFAKQ